MALGDYILCCKCEVKLIYDGDRNQREWWKERFGKEPEIECPDCKPHRTWVGLTDEEMTHTKHHMVEGAYQYSFKQGAKWAEAKLKQKNGYAEEKNT